MIDLLLFEFYPENCKILLTRKSTYNTWTKTWTMAELDHHLWQYFMIYINFYVVWLMCLHVNCEWLSLSTFMLTMFKCGSLWRTACLFAKLDQWQHLVAFWIALNCNKTHKQTHLLTNVFNIVSCLQMLFQNGNILLCDKRHQ